MRVSRVFGIGRPILLLALLATGTACDMSINPFVPVPVEMRWAVIEVQGVAVAGEDGRPVAGATVEEISDLYAGEDKSGTTDAEGRYTLQVPLQCPAHGECRTPPLDLLAQLDGFARGLAPRRESVPEQVLSAGRDTARLRVDFSLSALRPITLRVAGRVGGGSDGEPLQGARVTVRWVHDLPIELPEASTTSDGEGRYELTADHFCTLDASSCRVSFEIQAEWDGRWEYELFEDVDVSGDSLELTVDFDL